LAYGDAEYAELSTEYAENLDSLTTDFGTAWYQLMSRDVGNRQRCLGDELPPIQPCKYFIFIYYRHHRNERTISITLNSLSLTRFSHLIIYIGEATMGPLGPLTTPKPDYIPVRSAIQKSIDDEPSNIAAFATLATQCATTFRSSDYLGGCNGTSQQYGIHSVVLL
jgi:hypothetical protein